MLYVYIYIAICLKCAYTLEQMYYLSLSLSLFIYIYIISMMDTTHEESQVEQTITKLKWMNLHFHDGDKTYMTYKSPQTNKLETKH